jgi:DNA mismatch endonuclease (patch repair protein)
MRRREAGAAHRHRRFPFWRDQFLSDRDCFYKAIERAILLTSECRLRLSAKLVQVTRTSKRDPEIVSRSMRAVRSRGTQVESSIRSQLRGLGYKFRSNVADIPGKPDIVFARQKLIVFVDGDFWHGRQWKLRRFSTLEQQFQAVNNKDYWVAKISSNVRRDRRVDRQLRGSGWHVVRIWESDWKRNGARCLGRIQRFL